MSLKMQKKRKRGSLSRNDLRKIHANRSPKAQAIDNSLQAPLAPTHRDWVNNPDEYDVRGVDYPVDWRTQDEIRQLTGIDKTILLQERVLKKAEEDKDEDAYIHWKNLKELKQQRELLEWQKDHPFISAGTHTYGDGKKNYDWAAKHYIAYGFDLHNAERSFIHVFHLKRQDIYGLRVFLEKDNSKNPQWAAWYNYDGTLHLPPKEGIDDKIRTNTILHEIGHHVKTTNAKKLNDYWSGMYYRFKFPEKIGKRHSGQIRILNEAPYEIIYRYNDYFGRTVYFNPKYGLWHGNGLSTKDLKSAFSGDNTKRTMASEIWAETFAQYRLGNLRKEVKYRQEYLQWVDTDIERNKNIMKNYKGSKHDAYYLKIKRAVKGLETERIAFDAQYENLLKFEKMLKRWDQRGWNPDYDTEMRFQ